MVIHGKYGTSTYTSYYGMKRRCYNKNSRDYTHYGGKGVRVCDRWLGVDGFINFLMDMGEKPAPEYSLDRINNNGGYEPSNCRWATKTQQRVNTGMGSNNTSGYRGVTWDKHRKKWRAQLRHNYRPIYAGHFDNIQDAAKAYNKYATVFWGEDATLNTIY